MKVKIKTWEQMEIEFGLNTIGGINCEYFFTKDMRKLLPEDRIIEIHDDIYWQPDNHKFKYKISKDMIEKK